MTHFQAGTEILWSRDLYGLIELGERQTDRLAVCVQHQRPARRYRRQTDPEPTVRVQFDGDDLADAVAAAVVDALRPSCGERGR